MSIIIATTYLKAADGSPYSPNKAFGMAVEKNEGETHTDFEKRMWPFRAHYIQEGAKPSGKDTACVPANAFKGMLEDAAKRMSIPIPGDKRKTYTKHLEAGILVTEPLSLNTTREEVRGEWFFLPSDGKRGGGRRVWKCFPMFRAWKGKVVWQILDPAITKDVFVKVLEHGGKFIGIGRYRPMNRGSNGRFTVVKVKWEAIEE